ncbi:MAG: DNA repair protein RadA, partial [Pseudoalteromonas nigrifaciens]
MAKAAKVEFVCTECGMNYQRWQGQCRCGAWNTLAEFKPSAGQSKKASA